MDGRADLEKLASSLPYQRVKDSPSVPYYTDWKIVGAMEDLEYSTTEAELDDVMAEIVAEADVVLSPRGVKVKGPKRGYKVEPIGNTDVDWSIPVDSKATAIHAIRWRAGVRVTVQDGMEPLIIAVVGGNRGYTGYHIELEATGPGSIGLASYTPSGSIASISLKGRVGGASKLALATLEYGEGASYHIKHVEVEGSVDARILALGGEMRHYREDYILHTANAKLSLRSSGAASRSRLDIITNALNKAPETESVISFRGIVAEKGYLVHRGVARVTREAYSSKAELESMIIELGEDVKGYSVPVLEVQTGEVASARHATVIARPSEDEIFYLRQRGLSEQEAYSLITLGALEYSGVQDYIPVSLSSLLSRAFKA